MSDPCGSKINFDKEQQPTKPVTFSISFCDGRDDGRTPLLGGSREDNSSFDGEQEVNYFNNKFPPHEIASSLPAGSPLFGPQLRYVKRWL